MILYSLVIWTPLSGLFVPKNCCHPMFFTCLAFPFQRYNFGDWMIFQSTFCVLLAQRVNDFVYKANEFRPVFVLFWNHITKTEMFHKTFLSIANIFSMWISIALYVAKKQAFVFHFLAHMCLRSWQVVYERKSVTLFYTVSMIRGISFSMFPRTISCKMLLKAISFFTFFIVIERIPWAFF